MKCLVTADLHYSLKQWDWVHQTAGGFEVVILAGDHLDIASTLDNDAQAVVVLKYLERIGSRTCLLASSGNHDGSESVASEERQAAWLQEARSGGVFVDGDALEHGGWLFSLCPWWDGPHARLAVARQLERDAARAKERWAWVYHAPPDQTRVSWTGKGHFGDPELAGWIRAFHPDLVFCGHVHQSPFRPPGFWVDRVENTWVFNAGRQMGPVPAHLVLDFTAMTARWSSQAGEEVLDLANPAARPQPADGPD